MPPVPKEELRSIIAYDSDSDELAAELIRFR
jgi:hypothetical protein